jgi:hypothetical protein
LSLVRKLSFSDWLILADAWVLLAGIHLALSRVSYERMMISTSQSSDISVDSAGKVMTAANRMHWLVESASRLHGFQVTCLVKAITLFKILGKRNIPARVRIGACRMGDSVFAHAWVEVNQKPVGETDDIAQRFSILEYSTTTGAQVYV